MLDAGSKLAERDFEAHALRGALRGARRAPRPQCRGRRGAGRRTAVVNPVGLVDDRAEERRHEGGARSRPSRDRAA